MGDIVERLRDITPKGRDVSGYHQDDLLILQAADEIERLREALRGIIEADCEAIKMNDGVVCLKPGPYAVIARTALGEKE